MNIPIPLSSDLLAKAQSLGLNAADVTENFIRGGGHGGQKINKTNSLVQLVHHPSGIEVRVQRHREQSKNRLSAWKLLILKLEERERGEESALQQRIFKIRKQKMRRGRKSKEKMLQEKRLRGEVKAFRKEVES
ncbi:MAG: peptide chain release factor-like protein [Candidatus Peribacteraceae bacterium]|jgi:protein subunit release factor B